MHGVVLGWLQHESNNGLMDVTCVCVPRPKSQTPHWRKPSYYVIPSVSDCVRVCVRVCVGVCVRVCLHSLHT
jgi:hypothetical protein